MKIQLFREKDVLKVVNPSNVHFNKIGQVNTIFKVQTKPIMYVMDFPDGTTGTIPQEHLEKFNGVILKPIKRK